MLLESLRAECIEVGVSLADKSATLAHIAELAGACPQGRNVPPERILRGLREREALGSTGFGGGIAIPHCRLEGLGEFVVGLLSVPGGVDFEALDGAPVRLIVFILAPAAETDRHIRLLSAVSQALSSPEAVEEMVAAPTPQALRESFLRHARFELEPDERAARDLLHVFVCDDDLFQEILKTLAGLAGQSSVVLDAKNAGVYLSKIPLFADLWRDRPGGTCRLILAVLDKRITNETIRRIQRVTGPLRQRTDVLVIVQEVLHWFGAVGA